MLLWLWLDCVHLAPPLVHACLRNASDCVPPPPGPARPCLAARRFQVNPLIVDLVGEENTGKLCDSIRLMIMQVRLRARVAGHVLGGSAATLMSGCVMEQYPLEQLCIKLADQY